MTRDEVEALFDKPIHAVGKRRGDSATNLRTCEGDIPIASTIYSFSLDETAPQGWRGYYHREMVAERLALAWNACCGLSNEELERLCAAKGQGADQHG